MGQSLSRWLLRIAPSTVTGGPRRGLLHLEALETRALLSTLFAPIDGTGNNVANPTWGSAGTDLLRLSPVAYADGIS
jgi:hypothetical protein